MTVASETNKSGPYNGNGSTTVFAYGFRILDASHIEVIKTVAGVDSTVSPSAYTVSGVGGVSGSVTFTTAPASGEKITIIRNAPFTQTTDLENQGAYYAETVEEALDLAAMRDQQIAEELSRSVRIPVGATTQFDSDELVAAILALGSLYLGPKASAPAVDNNGNALTVGAVYWDTGSDQMFTWSGEEWRPTFLTGNAVRALITATGGQTVFTVPTYIVGANTISVFLNGLKVMVGADYTETDQNTVTFLSGLTVGDEVEVIVVQPLTIGQVGANGVQTVYGVTLARLFELRDGTVANLLADTTLNPSVVPVGSDIEAGGFWYEVAATGALDHHVSTAGGVKLYVKPLGDSVNYHQFGIDDTGATSANSAINAAFALASTTGWTVSPLPGTYLITAPIVIPAGLVHIANGDVRYVNSAATPANPMFINGAINGTFTGRTANGDITWTGGHFDANDTTTECLALGKAQNIHVRGVYFENLRSSHFIELNGVDTGSVKDCTFFGMNDPDGTRSFSEAINIDFSGNVDQFPFWDAASFDKTPCLNIQVSGNTFIDCLVSVGAHGYSTYGDGTFATRSRYITISGNTHIDNGANTSGAQADAIHCDGFSEVVISGEVIRNPKNNGIRLEDCIGVSVNGAYLSNVTGNAVFVVGDVADCASISISGLAVRTALDVVRVQKGNNVSITGCSGFDLRNGVWLEEADNCVVSGNTFEACSSRGVYVFGSSNRNTIVGNTIRNTAEANVEIAASSTNVVSQNILSLPAASKVNVLLNGGTSHTVAGNFMNGASLAAHVRCTGSATFASITDNFCQGTGTNSIVSDTGCASMFWHGNRFAGSGKTISDSGTSTVTGVTNFIV